MAQTLINPPTGAAQPAGMSHALLGETSGCAHWDCSSSPAGPTVRSRFMTSRPRRSFSDTPSRCSNPITTGPLRRRRPARFLPKTCRGAGPASSRSVASRPGGLSLILCGRAANFSLCEDVVAACSRLSLDSVWLERQARQLAPYTSDSLTAQANLADGDGGRRHPDLGAGAAG